MQAHISFIVSTASSHQYSTAFLVSAQSFGFQDGAILPQNLILHSQIELSPGKKRILSRPTMRL
ncbi:hypothetical protein RchiOBHm_Chr5g0000861 [Rosa chinensis]|uniref:Uncharacterized protein n=1 Tax=Rosa chinensis TaxID=74649 RepID=A0A2P6Q239_ROSCH|nr:hypothetical protein RchiOBHm_Chr5g0000861 [Rosa chinensis]